MAERESMPEKGAKLYRNFNAAVGAVALGASVLIPSAIVAGGFAAYGIFNMGQAGVGEGVRRYFEKKRKKKG